MFRCSFDSSIKPTDLSLGWSRSGLVAVLHARVAFDLKPRPALVQRGDGVDVRVPLRSTHEVEERRRTDEREKTLGRHLGLARCLGFRQWPANEDGVELGERRLLVERERHAPARGKSVTLAVHLLDLPVQFELEHLLRLAVLVTWERLLHFPPKRNDVTQDAHHRTGLRGFTRRIGALVFKRCVVHEGRLLCDLCHMTFCLAAVFSAPIHGAWGRGALMLRRLLSILPAARR